MSVSADPSTVVIRRQTAQVVAIFAARSAISAAVLATLVVLNRGNVSLVGVIVVIVVFVLVDGLELVRQRRFALRLDANGLRESMPNGARQYWFGPRGLALSWSEVTAIGVVERRWSTVVQIGAGGVIWTPTVVRRWKVLDDPEFDDKVAQIQQAWSRYANATWPPPPDEPGTVPRARGGA